MFSRWYSMKIDYFSFSTLIPTTHDFMVTSLPGEVKRKMYYCFVLFVVLLVHDIVINFRSHEIFKIIYLFYIYLAAVCFICTNVEYE